MVAPMMIDRTFLVTFYKGKWPVFSMAVTAATGDIAVHKAAKKMPVNTAKHDRVSIREFI